MHWMWKTRHISESRSFLRTNPFEPGLAFPLC